MPVYQLSDELVFPHPENAVNDGILAVGGDLSSERIILAYQNGIFPWYNEGDPIIWWSPNPRCILYTDKLNVSKSMRSLFNKNEFKVTLDQDFEQVMSECKKAPRHGQEGTWINNQMQQAYFELHKLGFAHSVEVWNKEELVGGLYGLFIGKCFFGESMFAKQSNASKYGFISLVQALNKAGVELIDCQTTTSHLLSLGAEEIDRNDFLDYLDGNCYQEETLNCWSVVKEHFENGFF
ncbi:MAG: leucyl/phenylalanyl-tRNA--protein transferase [Flavobacteriales bacterium]|nr:leucyl/phenylalanyl-tRNA--protein transferase [Flavobacteriales bacterium]